MMNKAIYGNEGHKTARSNSQRALNNSSKRINEKSCTISGSDAIMLVGKLFFTLAVIIMIGVLFFKTEAKGEEPKEADRIYYSELEDLFKDVLRAKLDHDGFIDAGINLSCVIYPNGEREYKVEIHHDRITNMDDNEKEEFLVKMSELKFTNASIPVTYSVI